MYNPFTIILVNVVFWFALNIFGAAAITSFTPKRMYDAANCIFRIRPFECRFYKAMNIHKWKDRLPIYRYNDSIFDRKRLSKKITKQYLETFISETCKAEFVHLLILLLGLSSVTFVFLHIEPLIVFLLTTLLMLFIHAPFIMIQRYNRRRLLKLVSRIFSECLEEKI